MSGLISHDVAHVKEENISKKTSKWERETQTQTQMVYCLQVLKTFNNFAAYNRIYIYIREIDSNYKHGKQTTRLEQLYTRYNIQNTR